MPPPFGVYQWVPAHHCGALVRSRCNDEAGDWCKLLEGLGGFDCGIGEHSGEEVEAIRRRFTRSPRERQHANQSFACTRCISIATDEHPVLHRPEPCLFGWAASVHSNRNDNFLLPIESLDDIIEAVQYAIKVERYDDGLFVFTELLVDRRFDEIGIVSVEHVARPREHRGKNRVVSRSEEHTSELQ